MTTLPTVLTRTTLAIGAALLLSALFGVWTTLLHAQDPVWFAFGFEVVQSVTGVFCVLMGLGFFRRGFGAGVGTLGAIVASAALLGYIASSRSGVMNDVPLKPLFGLRLLLGAGLGACAGLDAVRGDMRLALPRLLWGIGLGAGGVALLWAGWVGRDWIGAQGAGVQVALVLLGFALVTGLLAAGAEKLAGAINAGRRADEA